MPKMPLSVVDVSRRGMHVLTKPIEMEVLSAEVRGLIPRPPAAD